jgi:hypothetical protein
VRRASRSLTEALISPAHERRLALFVRQLGAGFDNLGAQLTQHSFGPPSHDKIRTGNARRPAAELRQHKASHSVDHGLVRVTPHQGAPSLRS